MKKLIALVLTAMITCLAFTGCGKKGYDDLAIVEKKHLLTIILNLWHF